MEEMIEGNKAVQKGVSETGVRMEGNVGKMEMRKERGQLNDGI